MANGKRNPEILDLEIRVTRESLGTIDKNLTIIDSAIKEIVESVGNLQSLLDANPLVNPRRIAQYDTNLRQSVDSLGSVKSLNQVTGQVESVRTNLKQLSDYYKDSYLRTMEQMDR